MHSGSMPFQTQFTQQPFALTEFTDKDTRYLKDMEGHFSDKQTYEQEINTGNPLIYTVYRQEVPHEAGQLLHCITIIEPGQVNNEFYMTKGHYHQDETCAEIYYGQSGQGLLLLQKGSETHTMEMKEGTVCYIPPGWGHRTVNIGSEPFVFFSVWPGNSGYDYERTQKEPFGVTIHTAGTSYQIVKK